MTSLNIWQILPVNEIGGPETLGTGAGGVLGLDSKKINNGIKNAAVNMASENNKYINLVSPKASYSGDLSFL